MNILKSILLLVSASMLTLIGITLKAQADHCSSIDFTCPPSHRTGGIIKIDPAPDSQGNDDPLPRPGSNSNPFTEVIRSSYLRVFGRYPSPEEINYWIGRSQQESLNLDRLVSYHRTWLKDGGDIEGTIVRSYRAILSREPSRDEINYWKQRIPQTGEIYSELIDVHKEWLRRGGR